jgi:hypothetical protein
MPREREREREKLPCTKPAELPGEKEGSIKMKTTNGSQSLLNCKYHASTFSSKEGMDFTLTSLLLVELVSCKQP